MVFLKEMIMRQGYILSILLAATIMSCSAPEDKKIKLQDSLFSKETTDSVLKEQLIVPGKSVGKLFLGQDMQEIGTILGKPEDGDAAMGKAWGIWKDIAIFSSYKDTSMTSKDVKQIVVSGTGYRTSQGITTGSSLEAIKLVYPKLKQAAVYTKGKDTLWIYDAVEDGIAFDLKRSGKDLQSSAITVHRPKEPVNSTYLTIHPGWVQAKNQ